ncbi:class I SAM-dependent DNA methyltransferase [Panacagrimonas sp.]|uniref:class I SAM-dependent DNA methyltransferase n=1 Tax=Panacagrimonas sp. TaxID=2480088 RepID=UPI003B5236AE
MTPDLEAFIARWQPSGGSERANYQLFLTELCAVLDLPQPDPAQDDTRDNAYVFERRVTFRHGDGSSSQGFIDLYRRGCFIGEAKKVKKADGKAFDDALLRARSQAENYARALPASEGRPPFLMVVDVGHVIELYAEFSQSGATYTPFPDPRSHRIRLTDLRKPEIQDRLRTLWLDPLALNPARIAAAVTRKIAGQLAEVARALEADGHPPQAVAGFLTRCLFTFFAEDVGLLPVRSFTELLQTLSDHPEQFVPLVADLWQTMDRGGFSVLLRKELLRFNGKLFKSPDVLPLKRAQIDLLIKAGMADWTQVEPAIIGTLLERALEPRERHKLGAHYTPRAYVERLVLPTVIEPLRDDWQHAQAAALTLAKEGDTKGALKELRSFHQQLCNVRVLDPACGSGNFLYVTLEHLKRLEGEVLNQMEALGQSMSLEAEGLTVDPHQFLGLEINPRAAALAELVLWIGYLQWHFRTRKDATPPLPVLKDFRTIECRDAVLAHDGMDYVTDDAGQPQTRWDGHTFKKHPVTGEDVPDEAARVPIERYANPRKADWPEAEFVVGNPPYLGARTIRLALGDGYLNALRSTYEDVPEHADFVMYWWDIAAEKVRAGNLRQFGLITTNSIRQEFSRKVLIRHMNAKPPVSLAFVIPDHPWVDSSDGAAVRVAMTVASAVESPGRLQTVRRESPGEEGEVNVELVTVKGLITSSLNIGFDVSRLNTLTGNARLSCVGYQLTGTGFVVGEAEARNLDANFCSPQSRIWPLYSGRDLTQKSRGMHAIDVCDLSIPELREKQASIYQWIASRVKPERDQNPRASVRDRWWIYGEARNTFRPALAGCDRAIATSLTAKFRTFQFVESRAICDSTTVMFALDSAEHLGTMSSRAHVLWSLEAGSRLGVGNDSRYTKGSCFETFPFPDLTPEQSTRIGGLAEAIDAHRKRQQAAHPDLTLTGCYNVLEALRQQRPLTTKEKIIHEQGLVSVLASLHDDLDREVLAAYGWDDLAPDLVGKPGGTTPFAEPDAAQARAQAELLNRLVALNAERATEEARGHIRWLRPDFQNPRGHAATQVEADVGVADDDDAVAAPAVAGGVSRRQPWPAELPAQVRAVADLLRGQPGALDLDGVAAHFSGRGGWKKRLPQILETLAALGRITPEGERYRAA